MGCAMHDARASAMPISKFGDIGAMARAAKFAPCGAHPCLYF